MKLITLDGDCVNNTTVRPHYDVLHYICRDLNQKPSKCNHGKWQLGFDVLLKDT